MLIGGLVRARRRSRIPRLGLDLFPRVEFPIVTVTTVLEGAAPETVEREVSQVLEESINTIEGIRSLRSASSDSLSLLFIEFELEYDVEREGAGGARQGGGGARPSCRATSSRRWSIASTPTRRRSWRCMVAGPHVDPHAERVRRQAHQAAPRAHPGRRQRRAGRRPAARDPHLDRSDPAERLRAGGRRRARRPAARARRAAGRAHRDGAAASTRSRPRASSPAPRCSATSSSSSAPGASSTCATWRTVEDGMAEERTVSHLNGRRGVALLVRRQSGENTVAVADAVKARARRAPRASCRRATR